MTAAEFVREFAEQPFRMGETDCACMIEAWVLSRTGVSLREVSGQHWDDEEEASALLERVALPIRLARAMRAGGFPMTREPIDGDVAAIVAGHIVTGAIRVGSLWMLRMGEGMSAVTAPRILMAWSVR